MAALYSCRYALIDRVLSPPAECVAYNLYAVCNHSGNTLGGHYTAFCRHPTLGDWHFYNDARYCVDVSIGKCTVHISRVIKSSVCCVFNAGWVQSPPVKFAAATPTCSSMNWPRRRTASISPVGCRGRQGALGETLPVPHGESIGTTDCEESDHRHPVPPRVLGTKWFMGKFTFTVGSRDEWTRCNAGGKNKLINTWLILASGQPFFFYELPPGM